GRRITPRATRRGGGPSPIPRKTQQHPPDLHLPQLDPELSHVDAGDGEPKKDGADGETDGGLEDSIAQDRHVTARYEAALASSVNAAAILPLTAMHPLLCIGAAPI